MFLARNYFQNVCAHPTTSGEMACGIPMITSWNGNNFRVSGLLWGESTQRRGASMFPLICAWTNGLANNRDACDLRRHRAHYDVTVMSSDVKHTHSRTHTHAPTRALTRAYAHTHRNAHAHTYIYIYLYESHVIGMWSITQLHVLKGQITWRKGMR